MWVMQLIKVYVSILATFPKWIVFYVPAINVVHLLAKIQFYELMEQT